MKIILSLILSCVFSTVIYAQVELDSNSKNGIAIPSSNSNINTPNTLNFNKNNKTPIVDIINPLEEPKPFSMELKSDLLDAGEELEKRWKDKEIKENYKKDQYLGDFKAKGSFLSIECRDHQFVDGDKVRVFVNGVMIESVVSLTSWYKGINVDLVNGFNQIDFVALNQGSSGPNTAQFRVFDAEGNLITSQEWNLTTGVKASIIVIKE